ncbi:MAG: hypothetical protein ABIU77_15595 [Ferruginibacter sp.]
MKKLLIAAILVIATSGVLSAQNTKRGNGAPGANRNVPGFVDVDKNGICDTYDSSGRSAVRGTGQGRRMNKGQGAGYGRGNGQCRSAKPFNRTANGRRG